MEPERIFAAETTVTNGKTGLQLQNRFPGERSFECVLVLSAEWVGAELFLRRRLSLPKHRGTHLVRGESIPNRTLDISCPIGAGLVLPELASGFGDGVVCIQQRD